MLPTHSTRASEPGPYSRHIPALDGLRGLAILGVMASHLFAGNPPGPVIRALQHISVFGAPGVDLFFVLSGLLITGILYDSLGDPRFFRKFYARRALRIFPLYYGVLITLLLLTRPLHLHWQHMQWVLLAYLQNTDLVMPFNQFGLGDGINIDHLWSLAVEEQFYFVWPILVFLVAARGRVLRLALALSVGALLVRYVFVTHHLPFHFINRSTLSRADSLLLGAALALLLRGPRHDLTLRLAPTVLALSSAAYLALLALAQTPSAPPWMHPHALFFCLGYTLLALASAALIAWCLRPSPLPRRIFELPLLRFFGKYSYGLYVLHVLALPFLISTFRGWFYLISPSKLLSIGGAGVLTMAVSVAAAWLSYNLYEKHFLRLKHLFDYDRRPAPARHAHS